MVHVAYWGFLSRASLAFGSGVWVSREPTVATNIRTILGHVEIRFKAAWGVGFAAACLGVCHSTWNSSTSEGTRWTSELLS